MKYTWEYALLLPATLEEIRMKYRHLVIRLDWETETAVVQLTALCLLRWIHSHAVCRCECTAL